MTVVELLAAVQSFVMYGLTVTVVVKFLGSHPRINAALFGACVASGLYQIGAF